MKKILFILMLSLINHINTLNASEFLKSIAKNKDDLANSITELKDTLIDNLGQTRDELIVKSNDALKIFDKYETANLFETEVKKIKTGVNNIPVLKDLIKIQRDKIESQMREFAKNQLSQDSLRAQEMAKANKQASQKIHDEVKKINQQINETVKDISIKAAKESKKAKDPNEIMAFNSIHNTSVKTSKEIHDLSVAAAKELHDEAVKNAKSLTENNISVAKNLSAKFQEALTALNNKYDEIIKSL